MSEKRYRSLLKGISWRFVGSIDTTILAWLFTGVAGKALKIGGIEFFTKIALYYFHERIWLAVRWARSEAERDGVPTARDAHRRSMVKAISWRVTGTIDTIVIAFLVTGEASKALSIGATEVATKMLLYYLHERAWQRIYLGKLRPGEVEDGGGI